MLTDQVFIVLIQTIGGVVLAVIGYARLRVGQKEGTQAIERAHVETSSQIQENTEKTEAIGVAVNGRVDALVQEKMDAVEQVYQARIDALELTIAGLKTALEAATKAPVIVAPKVQR